MNSAILPFGSLLSRIFCRLLRAPGGSSSIHLRSLGERLRLLGWLLGVALATGSLAVEQRTQTIPLASGWNLIAFQVLPANRSAAAVFGSIGATFIEARTFDAASQSWLHFSNPAGTDATVRNALAYTIAQIDPGRGYMVRVSHAVSSWSITGDAADAAPSIQVQTGWNLLGFRLGKDDLTAPFDLGDFLAPGAASLSLVTRLDAPAHRKFTPSNPADSDFTTGDPSRGYWGYSTPPQTFTPTAAASRPNSYFSTGSPLVVETLGEPPVNLAVNCGRCRRGFQRWLYS
jgi:hypothetical protein